MSEYTSEHWSLSFDQAQADAIVGKRLLVGVTYRDRNEEVVRVEQFHGEIIRASCDEGVILRLNGSNEERWLPPDLSRLEPATPGEYKLKATVEVVVDPDFLSTWTVYPPKS